ncbi:MULTISPECIES: ATP-dependent zinc metalloprotease FtsH [Geobacter]|uniref:ATP-dependent zinc metalloprotease FtsH n=1 Tax=Geobacter TaxID=28231 RepID=UPI0025729B5A|nr:ATP-dependent zinc metalloprotease FtsH [Geobacter sulfurreducens]BEH10829.1 ATP-dependent zinc metalloprotease FtsH [Geobacter sulfurreducens subsp. ethanolicus]BET58674.1 ATP-dependent zinc metalloprotease FtsH [Geobacter sp. 60473]
MGQSVWKPILWMLGLLVIFNLIYTYVARQSVDGGAVVSYSRFRAELAAGNIKRITIKGTTIAGDFRNKITVDQPAGDKTVARETAKFSTVKPAIDDPSLMADLQAKNVEVTAVTTETSPVVSGLLYVLPWILIIGVWWLAMRGMRGQGPTSVMGNFSKSGAKMYTPSAKVKVTFDDVAGMENPKMELKEIVDYLRDPKKFQRIGGKVPKGVLLVGPPGTGKTLLARAVAGEADVTFLSISASQFIEMFVGVGAGRVRDLFATAKKSAPSIIFIDELDAVGRSRGAGLGGGHDEREQTLNQLLSEMDGFDSHDEVIVMAATNRPDVLDPALLRPGRFDRHVVIDRPDWRDREKILHVHTRKIPLDNDVDLAVIARGTPGMAGADLENLVNEAAILAARENAATVTMEHMERAKDKVLMGGERKMFITEQEKRITAYHEAGHTIVAKLLPGTDPVHKVTIIPRGQALGVTQQLPEDDRYHYPKSYLMNRLSVALGGRQAERAVFGDLSTGAQNDLKMVNDLAEKMVCQWGMSDKIGAMTFSRGEEHPFLGRKLAEEKTFSEQMAWLIDQEIAAIIKEAEQKADGVIANNRGKLDALVDALMEEETLDGKRIDEVLASVT